MKTPAIKSLKNGFKALVMATSPQDNPIVTHGGIPVEFLAAGNGIFPASADDFFFVQWDNMSLGYFTAVNAPSFGHNSFTKEGIQTEWNDTFDWLDFLSCKDLISGRCVAHALSTHGLLSESDLLIAGLKADNAGWTVAEEWARCHPLPENFFFKAATSKKWTREGLFQLAKVAAENDHLPRGFQGLGISETDGSAPLAFFILDHKFKLSFFSSENHQRIAVPWTPSVWKTRGPNGETVAHRAASYGALPPDLPEEILDLKNDAGFSVRDVQAESKKIRKMMKDALGY